MLNRIKCAVINQLWDIYRVNLPCISLIQSNLRLQYQTELLIDHFALIDLSGPYTGIATLSRLFSYLDYEVRGQDYLAEKQNNFAWLTEKSTASQLATSALPQIVIADFHREALAPEVLKIVDRYAAFAQPLEEDRLQHLHKSVLQQDEMAAREMLKFIMNYLKGRDWPLPTVNEFEVVKSHNELLAWVLVMGRQVNHFAWAVHLSKSFNNLAGFNNFLSSTLKIPLNKRGGIIKGNPSQGIEQSATQAVIKSISLMDGNIDLSDRFIEFVWRHPQQAQESILWKDYFHDFVADNADRVVESLFNTTFEHEN